MIKPALACLSLLLLSSCSSMPDFPWNNAEAEGPTCQSEGKDYEAGTIIVEDGTLTRCMQTDVDSAYTWVEYHPQQDT